MRRIQSTENFPILHVTFGGAHIVEVEGWFTVEVKRVEVAVMCCGVLRIKPILCDIRWRQRRNAIDIDPSVIECRWSNLGRSCHHRHKLCASIKNIWNVAHDGDSR